MVGVSMDGAQKNMAASRTETDTGSIQAESSESSSGHSDKDWIR